ncbi:hypothetical protein HDU90_004323, partial [Geranomyces variabilis]
MLAVQVIVQLKPRPFVVVYAAKGIKFLQFTTKMSRILHEIFERDVKSDLSTVGFGTDAEGRHRYDPCHECQLILILKVRECLNGNVKPYGNCNLRRFLRIDLALTLAGLKPGSEVGNSVFEFPNFTSKACNTRGGSSQV